MCCTTAININKILKCPFSDQECDRTLVESDAETVIADEDHDSNTGKLLSLRSLCLCLSVVGQNHFVLLLLTGESARDTDHPTGQSGDTVAEPHTGEPSLTPEKSSFTGEFH